METAKVTRPRSAVAVLSFMVLTNGWGCVIEGDERIEIDFLCVELPQTTVGWRVRGG